MPDDKAALRTDGERVLGQGCVCQGRCGRDVRDRLTIRHQMHAHIQVHQGR